MNPGTSFEQIGLSWSYDVPCQTSVHSRQWFMRRIIFKVFAIYTYIKL